jgi:hypothetical protein
MRLESVGIAVSAVPRQARYLPSQFGCYLILIPKVAKLTILC